MTAVQGTRTFLQTRLSIITRVVTVESVVPCPTCSGPNYPALTPITEADDRPIPGVSEGGIFITSEEHGIQDLTDLGPVTDEEHDIQGITGQLHQDEDCPKCGHKEGGGSPRYTPPTMPRPLRDDATSGSASDASLQTPSQTVVTGAATENGAIRDWIYAVVFALLIW